MLSAVSVGKLAHNGNGGGICKGVDSDDPNANGVIDAHLVLDNRTGGVDDAHIESAHHQAQQVDQGDENISLAFPARSVLRFAFRGNCGVLRVFCAAFHGLSLFVRLGVFSHMGKKSARLVNFVGSQTRKNRLIQGVECAFHCLCDAAPLSKSRREAMAS